MAARASWNGHRKGTTMPTARHILVPTDGTRLSTRTVKSALDLARALKARVTALHVIAPFTAPVYMDIVIPVPELYSPEDYKRRTQAYARRMLEKIEQQGKAMGVRCESLSAVNDLPWKAIIATAKSRKCDLIVMASHGRRGVEALLLGSETHKVLTHSKVPVLVCR
jgi:nucleotide-binding universal stress UspA family protein